MSNLPDSYDAWRTSGPDEGPTYDVKVTITLHFDSAEDADKAQKLMESREFDLQSRTEYSPGQPMMIYTAEVEAGGADDFDYYVTSDMIGPEIMGLVVDHELDTRGLPVERDPDEGRDLDL